MKPTEKNEVAWVCLRWGERYPWQYVSRLAASLARNTTSSLPLYCLSDSASLPKSVSDLGVRHRQCPNNWWGWWQKIHLFDREFWPFRHLIFIDLDVVIMSSIDSLITRRHQYDWIFAPDAIDQMSSSFMVIDLHSNLASDVRKGFDAKWVCPEDIDQDYLRKFVDAEKYRILELPAEAHMSYKFFANIKDWRERATNPRYSGSSLDHTQMFNFHGFPKPLDLEADPERWPFSREILENWVNPHQIESLS